MASNQKRRRRRNLLDVVLVDGGREKDHSRPNSSQTPIRNPLNDTLLLPLLSPSSSNVLLSLAETEPDAEESN